MKSGPHILAKPVFEPLRAAFLKGLDFLLPPLCFGCSAEVETQGGLCPACWSKLRFITRPWCEACGFPFAHDMPEGVLCASCHDHKPAFDHARAALAYDQLSRPLVLSFKHAERTEGLKTMARWLQAAGGEILDRADVVVPVPLHKSRLLRRRYNQSALLAKALGQEAGLGFDPFSLVRVKNTKSQAGLTRVQRAANVRAAFRVPPSGKPAIAGKTVVLVDDVFTTGATAENAARALKKGGAEAVMVLTLARVVEPLKKDRH